MVSVVFETYLLEIERGKLSERGKKHGTFGTLFIHVTLNILHDRKKNCTIFPSLFGFTPKANDLLLFFYFILFIRTLINKD